VADIPSGPSLTPPQEPHLEDLSIGHQPLCSQLQDNY
jgi:hypothetical protein